MFRAFTGLFLLVFFASPFVLWWFAWRPLPISEGAIELGPLRKLVSVNYDARSIPSVYASDADDLFCAQGFLVSAERFFQMDIMRRVALGRTAQIFGPSCLPFDRLMRSIGFERLALKELETLSPDSKRMLESYCRGVNAYLSDNADKLPLEFALIGYKPLPWRPVDSLAVLKHYQYEMDESWRLDELRWRAATKIGFKHSSRLFQDNLSLPLWSPYAAKAQDAKAGTNKKQGTLPQRALPISSLPEASLPRALQMELSLLARAKDLPYLNSPLWGSTAFTVPPVFSASGGALLAADKHRPLSRPASFYLISMQGADWHIAGAALPGVPGVLFGRNDYIAWSSVNMRADVQDLYVEQFIADGADTYKVLSESKEAEIIKEVIPVRFAGEVEHKISITRHGPVLLRHKATGISLSWTGSKSTESLLDSLLQINAAQSVDQLKSALLSYDSSPQVFLFADTGGNTGMRAAGRIPVRGQNFDGTTMAQGWTNDGEWLSSVKPDQLPVLTIPADFGVAGFGRTNTPCNGIAAGQMLTPPPGSAPSVPLNFGHQWQAPYKANRLALSLPRPGPALTKLRLSDLAELQADSLASLSHLLYEEMRQAMLRMQQIDKSQLDLMKAFKNWDGQLKGGNGAAAAYESLALNMVRRIVESKLGASMAQEYFELWPLWPTLLEYSLRYKPVDLLPSEERTYDGFLVSSFATACSRLKVFFNNSQPSDWSWTSVHQGSFRHPVSGFLPLLSPMLDSAPIGLDGDQDSLNSCDYQVRFNRGSFPAMNGPTLRMLIDMSDPDKIYALNAPGQSGHLVSPFMRDQINAWQRSDPFPLAFSRKQAESQTKKTLILGPPGSIGIKK